MSVIDKAGVLAADVPYMFDGHAALSRDRGKPGLPDIITALDASAVFQGRFSNTTRPTDLATWQAIKKSGVPGAGEALIYNTDDNAYNVWDGAGWRDMAGTPT